MDFKEVRCVARNKMDFAQDRNQWRICKSVNEPPGSLKAMGGSLGDVS